MIANRLVARFEHEGGAVMILAAVAAAVAVIAAALSIDIGAHALKKRELQKVADLAAIDAAYALYDIEGVTIGPLEVSLYNGLEADARERAAASVSRNGLDANELELFEVEVGEFDTPRTEEREFEPCLTLMDLSVDCDPNAVRVTLADDVPRYFDILSSSSPVTTVSAVAQLASASDATAPDPGDDTGDPGDPGDDTGGGGDSGPDYTTVSVGSFLARLDTNQSALLTDIFASLLGATPGSVSTEAVSYNGISQAQLTLDGLLLGFNQVGYSFGTVDEMLTAQITVRDLAQAMVRAVTGDAVAEASLQVIESNMGGSVGFTSFSLLNIVSTSVTDPDSPEAASLRLNALQTITSAVLLANGENAAGVDVTLTPAGRSEIPAELGEVSIRATVIEPPQQATGGSGTTARTGQVRLSIHYSLDETLLQSLLGALTFTQTNFRYEVELVGATARIDDIDCVGDGVDVSVRTKVGEGGGALPYARVRGVPDFDTLPLDLTRVGSVIEGPLEVAPTDGGQTPVRFTSDGADGTHLYGTLVPVSYWPSTPVAHPFLGEVRLLLGGELGSLLSDASAELQQVIDTTMPRLLDVSGLMIGGADVTAYAPACSPDGGSDPGDGDDGDGNTDTTVPDDGGGTATADRVPILVK